MVFVLHLGLTAFVEGRIERKFWSPAFAKNSDLDVRKLAAIEALSRHGRAQAKMLGSINLTPNLWPTAALIDWLRILKKLDCISNPVQRLTEANQILHSRLTYAGTTLKFSNEDSDFWWWLMDSADANAARLILAVLDDPAWADELPRMVVGSLAAAPPRWRTRRSPSTGRSARTAGRSSSHGPRSRPR